MFKVEATFETAAEAAQFFSTLHVLKENRSQPGEPDAPKAEPAAPAVPSGRGKKAAAAAPAAAAPAAPAPAKAAAKAAPAITLDQARAKLTEYAAAKKLNPKQVVAWLEEQFEVPRISELPADKYQSFFDTVDAELAAGAEDPDPLA